MKKVLILGTVLSSLLFLGACSASKKEVTPAPTVVEQNFPNPTVKIGLTIHVLASSEAARSAGLDGAKVIAKQNGNTYQGTTDESGIVTFGDLKEGYVSYYVTKAGYAKINGLIELEYDGTPIVNGGNGTAGSDVTVNNEQFYAISEVATLPRLGASVSGVLMADLDFGGAADVTPVNAGKVVL
ncbi:MAG TPA: hypothetical protein VL947_04455, partial [Cytophagales bacterium]|nr:hypothetical protein [Cytophagales bacterium]